MRKEFTGKHMTMVLVAGFGVVIAVNLFMAATASRVFSGTVVENSYVASQKFNGWLENAKRAEELGWKADVSRDEEGHLVIRTESIPTAAVFDAVARRPLGEREDRDVELLAVAPDYYRSKYPLDSGRWTIRLNIASGELQWSKEVPLG